MRKDWISPRLVRVRKFDGTQNQAWLIPASPLSFTLVVAIAKKLKSKKKFSNIYKILPVDFKAHLQHSRNKFFGKKLILVVKMGIYFCYGSWCNFPPPTIFHMVTSCSTSWTENVSLFLVGLTKSFWGGWNLLKKVSNQSTYSFTSGKAFHSLCSVKHDSKYVSTYVESCQGRTQIDVGMFSTDIHILRFLGWYHLNPS